MNMTRRALLAALAGGLAAAQDPERLLWTPGKKLISIPKPAPAWPGWADPPAIVLSGSGVLTGYFNVGDLLSFGSDPQCYRVTAVTRDRLVLFVPFWPAVMVRTDPPLWIGRR